MKNYGVKVFIKESSEYGFIVRRLNCQNYEIILENDKVVNLSPNEFIEIEKEEK